jgi:hypothetical protein
VDPALGASGEAWGYGGGNPLQTTDPLGLWPDWSALGKGATNFLYGAVDGVTFGLASAAVNGLGWDSEWLDSCSSAFKAGGYAEMALELGASLLLSGGTATPLVLAKMAAKNGVKATLKAAAKQAGEQAARLASKAAGAARSAAAKVGQGARNLATRAGRGLDNAKAALKGDDGYISVGFGSNPLRARADEIHGVLHPRAQNGRTTAVLGTQEGPVVVGGGVRDLDASQKLLLREGDIPAALPNAHAEITVLEEAARRGLTPTEIATTTNICAACRAALERTGATVIGRRSAVWD